jgi:anti-sigma factor RsiW
VNPEELSAFIDGEVAEPRAAAIAAHVAGCSACRTELDRTRRIDDAIRHQDRDPELASMRESLMREVSAPRRRLAWRTAAAAAVMVAFLAGLKLATAPASPSGGSTAGNRTDRSAPMLEALELDAASLRLELETEDPEPALRQRLDERLDAVVTSLEQLRTKTRSN